MDLIFWWMLIVWLVAIATYWLAYYFLFGRHARKQTASVLPAAHTNRLTSLPEYIAVMRQYRILTCLIAGLLTLSLLAGIFLTARPATVSTVIPTENNRDIMLCLDASGSVLREDTTLLDRFSSLVQNFGGQRFGLTLFNSSAATIIPLNDNYQIISQQLKIDAKAFKVQDGQTFTNLTNGTLTDFDSGTSLAGDGLASCLEEMGSNTSHRSQSVVLATDNEVHGTQIVSMAQDTELAKDDGIHVFVVDPGVSDTSLSSDHAELKILAEDTDGVYYSLSDPTMVSSLINTINAQTPETYVGVAQYATSDNPKPYLYIATLLAIISLIVLWRLEL
jgi:Ca-activated chloride channel family protein